MSSPRSSAIGGATRASWAALLLLGATAAQQPADPAPLERVIHDLLQPERSVEALRILATRGKEGSAALVRALQDRRHSAPKERAIFVYALGKLGAEATVATNLLLAELDGQDGDVLRNVCWALGEIGPHAEAQGIPVAEQLSRFHAVPGGMHQEWAFALARLAVGTRPSASELLRLLGSPSHADLVAASNVLCQQGDDLSAELADALRAAWQRVGDLYHQHGNVQRAALDLARAVARRLPDSAEAARARAVLVYHFDVEVRLQAVMECGRFAEHARVSVPALLAALTDGSPLVRREAVTALGMLGAAARSAVADLEALAHDADSQVRVRAAAALRAIARGR